MNRQNCVLRLCRHHSRGLRREGGRQRKGNRERGREEWTGGAWPRARAAPQTPHCVVLADLGREAEGAGQVSVWDRPAVQGPWAKEAVTLCRTTVGMRGPLSAGKQPLPSLKDVCKSWCLLGTRQESRRSHRAGVGDQKIHTGLQQAQASPPPALPCPPTERDPPPKASCHPPCSPPGASEARSGEGGGERIGNVLGSLWGGHLSGSERSGSKWACRETAEREGSSVSLFSEKCKLRNWGIWKYTVKYVLEPLCGRDITRSQARGFGRCASSVTMTPAVRGWNRDLGIQ